MAKTSRKVDGRPSWQFYPSDWLEDTGLRLCDLDAKGLWIEVLCHAFNSEERGVFRSKPKQILSKALAKLVSEPVSKVEAALKQLINNKVCESDGETYIYNRRMVRDEKQRRSKAEAGSKGGRVSKPKQKLSKTEAKGGSTTPSTLTSSSPTPASSPIEKKERVTFDEFWKIWPHRVAKTPAKKRWAKMKVDKPLLEKMVAAIKLAQNSDKWKRGIIPNPATWLHEERWNDEIPDPDAAKKALLASVFEENQ